MVFDSSQKLISSEELVYGRGLSSDSLREEFLVYWEGDKEGFKNNSFFFYLILVILILVVLSVVFYLLIRVRDSKS